MDEQLFLSGKVRKRSLPALNPPTGPDAPMLKRLLLPQGELAQFYDADAPIHYIAFLELTPGSIRGNHYHEAKEEFVYLIAGELRVTIEAVASGEREVVSMAAGDLLFLSTRIAHAFEVIKPGQAIEFSSARFDPKDTFRRVLAQ